ncbi:30S ribosome-binding factor RbfA [Patescibacteria group bacterium]|nr:30S ribosome-binding factor RbfA [Patescibacteria group bacterium]
MSKRSEQVSEVIKHQLNEFIIKELEPPKDSLITITKIETSEDLKYTLIFVSILPVNKTGTAFKFLNNNLGRMRHHLNKNLKIHHIPQLKIVVDDSALKTRKVEREIEKLDRRSCPERP